MKIYNLKSLILIIAMNSVCKLSFSQISDSIQNWLNTKNEMGFLENKGQMKDMNNFPVPNVLFKTEAPNLNFWITDKGITIQTFTIRKVPIIDSSLNLTLLGSEEKVKPKTNKFFDWERIDIELKNATILSQNIVKLNESAQGHANYFYPHCPNGIYEVKEFGKVIIQNVYPGIDWVFYRKEDGTIKYDFIVHENADYTLIELLYKSKSPVSLIQNVELVMQTSFGNIKEQKPISFYNNVAIETTFQLNHEQSISINGENGYETSISFQFSGYNLQNRTSDLIIDPEVVWGTFYGGNALDGPMSIDSDNQGNIFIGGYVTSTDYPVLNSGTYFTGTFAGSQDGFITKFANDGTRLWSTYYGGTNYDFINSLVVDNSGNVWATGETSSSDFPVQNMGGFYQGTYGTTRDVIILKFSNNGSRLLSTYYGGSGSEVAYSITNDNSDNIWLTGTTNSTNFPVLDAGTFYQSTRSGVYDAFLIKFNSSFTRVFSTYYGGTSDDIAYAICADGSGNVFVSGDTKSSGFPLLNASTYYDNTFSGTRDGFLLKFSSTGARLWATFYGGNGHDYCNSIAVDGGDNVWILGATNSTDLPVLNAGGTSYYQNALGGGSNYDAFILKFNNSGTRILATYYGGSGAEYLNAITFDNIAVDGCNNIYFSFESASNSTPTIHSCTGGYFDNSRGGTRDQFIVRFTNDGTRNWATYIGGDGDDFRTPIAIDHTNNLWLTGEWKTVTSNATYPLMANGTAYYDGTYNASDDAMLMKFDNTTLGTPSATDATCDPDGSATITVTNLCTPIDYIWDNGSQTLASNSLSNTISNVDDGTYTVTVRSNCDTLVQTVTVATNCILPIELLSFDAALRNEIVTLNWTTATEINNDYFIIEKSQDGINWSNLDQIDASGNSTIELNYISYDFNPELGNNYYRLKQVDFNGQYSYSPVKNIDFRLKQFYVSPNPSEGNIYINAESKANIEFVDYTGKILFEQKINQGKTLIDLSNLSAGIYFINFKDENNDKLSTDKFIKR